MQHKTEPRIGKISEKRFSLDADRIGQNEYAKREVVRSRRGLTLNNVKQPSTVATADVTSSGKYNLLALSSGVSLKNYQLPSADNGFLTRSTGAEASEFNHHQPAVI